MTSLRDAAQQALEALQKIYLAPEHDEYIRVWWPACDEAITALRAALAEPVQEPQLKRIHPLDMPLEVFVEDLSTRPRNIINAEMGCFTHLGDEYIKPPLTVRHLLMFSRKELRKWPNLGKRSLNEIEEMLRNRGLQLWDEHDERSLRLLREHPTYFQEPAQEPVVHSVIAGALFDFMGWLTSRRERIVLSSADNASPAVEAITEFAKMRGLSLDDAKVQDWNTAPPQRKPLTEEEIYGMYSEPSSDAEMVEFARSIERAHGIGEKDE